MKNSKILNYDGSFNGFLTVLYTAFDKGWNVTEIAKKGSRQNELFSNTQFVKTDVDLAKKLWFGLERKSKTATKLIYFSFLSEQKEIEFRLYHYVRSILSKQNDDEPSALFTLTENLKQLMNKVEKEKRRMEVFANFQLTESNATKALLKPKYNVLPLLSRHLRMTLRNKHWLVFDTKRNYGISYASGKLEISSGNANVRQAV